VIKEVNADKEHNADQSITNFFASKIPVRASRSYLFRQASRARKQAKRHQPYKERKSFQNKKG